MVAPFPAFLANGVTMANKTALLEDYTPEDEAATQFKNSARTWQRWRRLGTGPTPTIIGNKVYYHVDDLKTWLRAQRREAPDAMGS